MRPNTPSPQHSSKVHYLVSILEKSEKKKFMRWLKFELNGTNEQVVELYGSILEGKSMDEIIAIKWGIDIKKENNKKVIQQFHALANQLVKLLEEFLVIEKWRKDKLKKEMELVRIYNERAAHTLVLPALNKARKSLDETKWRNSYYFQSQYQLETELRAHLIMNPLRKSEYKRKVKRGEIESYVRDESLKEELQVGQKQEDFRRECFLYAFLLEYWNLNVQKQAQVDIANMPLDTAIEGLKEKDLIFGFDGAYQLYQLTHALFRSSKDGRDEENVDWQAFLSKVENARAILPSSDWVNLIRMLINYQNQKVLKQANARTYKNLLLLYEISMRGMENQVDKRFYKNIITICVNLSLFQKEAEKAKTLEKAKNYLKNWKNHLPDREREEAFLLSKTIYDFGCGNYLDIIEDYEVHQGHFSDVYYEISYRFVVLQAKYEAHPVRRELVNECNNLKRFIDRQKLLKHRKEECLNRIQLFRKFIQARTKLEFLDLWESMKYTTPLSWAWLHKIVKEKLGI